MDNRYPCMPQALWSPTDRQTAGTPLGRIAIVVSTFFVCMLTCPNLKADSLELADGRELSSFNDVRLGSVEGTISNEIIYQSSHMESDATNDAPDPPVAIDTYNDSDSNSRQYSPYDQYAGQPSRPDRWDNVESQFPWLDTPGCCDDWRVGPKVNVQFDGLFLYRTNVESSFLTNSLGPMPPNVLQYVERFEHAGGARGYVTSQDFAPYAVQFGIIGAADWEASAESQFTDIANALNNETQLNSYTSSLHAIELNVFPRLLFDTRWFLGARYVGFDEDFTQLTDRVNFNINNNNLATGFNDELSTLNIDNRLLGAHMGFRRDVWSENRTFSLEMLINGGPYCNMISRDETYETFVTVNPPDDPDTVADESHQTEVRVGQTVRNRRATKLSFFGDAALTGVYRFHPCISLRAGYQAVWLTGAHLASDSFGDTSTVFFHGLHCGLEYRR
ncbi:MAG: hypothetical protein ABGX16_25405 [Pirellulales bacterium]